MNTATQEMKIEEQGPTCVSLWDRDRRVCEDVTISYTGRGMPWRRASGLTSDEQEKVRKGEIVVIGGCPPSRGTTWRQVIYRGGRYRTRVPSEVVAGRVEAQVYDWRMNVEGWRRVREGVKTWDEFTRIKKLMQYGPQLLAELGLPTEQRDINVFVQYAYKWDNQIPGDE